jgi:sulfur relay (sulfurtransferase) complex TusBCD TusD component (DsrE family)
VIYSIDLGMECHCLCNIHGIFSRQPVFFAGIDLVICISAAQRRGLLSLEESRRQNRTDQDLAPGFRISGLGQLVEATINADRFIVFPGA